VNFSPYGFLFVNILSQKQKKDSTKDGCSPIDIRPYYPSLLLIIKYFSIWHYSSACSRTHCPHPGKGRLLDDPLPESFLGFFVFGS